MSALLYSQGWASGDIELMKTIQAKSHLFYCWGRRVSRCGTFCRSLLTVQGAGLGDLENFEDSEDGGQRVGEHDVCDRGDNIRRCHWRGFYPCQFHFQRRSLHLDKSSLQIGFLIISTVHPSCVVMGIFSLCSQGPFSVMTMIRI